MLFGKVQGAGAGRVRVGLAVRAEPAGLRHLPAVRPRRLFRTALTADVRPRRAQDQRRRSSICSPRAGRPSRGRPLCAKLLSGTILQSDETGVRVGKKSWWTWVFHHGQDCCFSIRPSRGKDVVEAFLGEHRPDFWVSDRFAAQMGWAKKDNQVCLAHLIREATYAVEAGNSTFAPALRKLLKRACGIARRRPDLADATLRTYAYALNAKLDALMRLTPTHAAQAQAGDRGLPAPSVRLPPSPGSDRRSEGFTRSASALADDTYMLSFELKASPFLERERSF